MSTESSSGARPPSEDSDSSGLHSSSSSRESLAALVLGTVTSLCSIATLAYAWLATDRFQAAPWWAGPTAIAIAALPTSVRAAAVKSVLARLGPSKTK